MARRNKVYDDDDGRTIADMSEVSGPSMFVPRKSGRKNPPIRFFIWRECGWISSAKWAAEST